MTIDIITGEVSGTFSKTAIALLQKWRILHTLELLEDWKLAEQKKIIREIPPLE